MVISREFNSEGGIRQVVINNMFHGSKTATTKLTVGLPVYNGEAFLVDALSALMSQSYGDFTVLISDNASTDRTPEIARQWADRDSRITVVRQPHNLGATGNFLFVLEQANTDYFMWHAHDDWLDENYIEVLLGLLESNPGWAMACSAVLKHYTDGRPPRCAGFPDVMALGRWKRLARLTRKPGPSWFYGIYRTTELRQAYRFTRDFPCAWAGDRLTPFWFILNDRCAGSEQTAINVRIFPGSFEQYAPQGMRDRLAHLWRYLKANFQVLAHSPMSFGNKMLSIPFVLRHAFRTSGISSKWHRHSGRHARSGAHKQEA